MKISVVIPCYNAERLARRAVESCMPASPRCEVEIVCVDDCSTDGTHGVLAGLASAAENVKVVRHDANRKPLEARRSGLAAATGAYVVFLDADDRFAEGTLDAIAEKLLSDPVDCLFFGGRPVLEGGAALGGPQLEHLTRLLTPPTGCASREDLLEAMFVRSSHAWGVCGKVWRMDVARKCFDLIPHGPFMMAEDATQCIVSMKFVQTVAILDIAGYLYTADTGCMANEVLACRNIDQRMLDLSAIQQTMRQFRQTLAPDDAYLRYLKAFERRILRDFLVFCAPYLHKYRGTGLYEDGIKPEHMGMMAMWWADVDRTSELFRSTRWFWRLYRKWLAVKAALARDDSRRDALNALGDCVKRMTRDEVHLTC